MRYVFSDIHGKYDLFASLIEKIKLTASDTVYICGDVIDKGERSLRTLRLVTQIPGARVILGNHEDMFLKFYRSLMSETGDLDLVLKRLREYFPCDRELLDFDVMDWLELLPYYVREDEFICVHAGLPTDDKGRLLQPEHVSPEIILNDRRFKEPTFRHESSECVFFGHTQTNGICGQNKILAYLKDRSRRPVGISDFYKIHLDTGAWCSGVLGCFCVDTLGAYYVGE